MKPGSVAKSAANLTANPGVVGTSPSPASQLHEIIPTAILPLPLIQEGHFVSYWRKDMHLVLVNRLGGLRLPRTNTISLTDRHYMM